MLKRLIQFVLLSCLPLTAQTYSLAPVPKQTFFNNIGIACAGCKLYSYAAGTTTPQATYVDAASGTPNPNPLTLDASGSGNVWLNGVKYKLVLKDQFGATVWTVDNISNANFLPLTGGTMTGLIRFSTDVVPHTPANVLAFGAVCDGTTDDSTAIQTAILAACAAHVNLYLPARSCVVTKSLNATGAPVASGGAGCSQLHFVGDVGSPDANSLSPGSTIVDKLTETYPVVDFSGCQECGFDWMSVYKPVATTASTAAFLMQDWSSSYLGGPIQIDHSVFAGGGSLTKCAGLVYYTDLADIEHSRIVGLSTSTTSGSTGLVIGNGAGLCSAVTSKFAGGLVHFNSMTQATVIHNRNIEGRGCRPAIELTGSATYDLSGDYGVISNCSGSSSGLGVVQVDSFPGGISLNAINLNLENQAGSNLAGVSDFYLASGATMYGSLTGGRLNAFDGAVGTGGPGYIFGGPGDLLGMSVHSSNAAIDAGIFNMTGRVDSSSISITPGTVPIGTFATGSNHTSITEALGSQSASTVLAALGMGGGSCIAINGGTPACSNMLINGPSGSGGITVTGPYPLQFPNGSGGSMIFNDAYVGSGNIFVNGVQPATNCTGGQVVSGYNASGVAQCVTPSVSTPHGTISGSLSATALTANELFSPVQLRTTAAFQTFTWNTQTFTCSVNPVVEVVNCGASLSPCTSPTVLGTTTVTGTGTGAVVASGSTAANDYLSFRVSSGTCTAFVIQTSASY